MTRTTFRRYIRRVRWGAAAIALSWGAGCTPVLELELPDLARAQFAIFYASAGGESVVIAGAPDELAIDLNTEVGLFNAYYLTFEASGEELQIPSGRLEPYAASPQRALPTPAAIFNLRGATFDDEEHGWFAVDALPKALEDFRLPAAAQDLCFAAGRCFHGELCKKSCASLPPAPPSPPQPPAEPRVVSPDPRCAPDGWPPVSSDPNIHFVDPLAPAGGDGSRARPFNSIASARLFDARTIALRRGDYPPESLFISRVEIIVLGACIGETHLELDLVASSGASILFRDLSVELTASIHSSSELRIEDAALDLYGLSVSGARATLVRTRASMSDVSVRSAALAIEDSTVRMSFTGVDLEASSLHAERSTFDGGTFTAQGGSVRLADVAVTGAAGKTWLYAYDADLSVSQLSGVTAGGQLIYVSGAPNVDLRDLAASGDVPPLVLGGIIAARLERLAIAATDPSADLLLIANRATIADVSLTLPLGARILAASALEVDRVEISSEVSPGEKSASLTFEGSPAHLRSIAVRGGLVGIVARDEFTVDSFDISSAQVGVELTLSGREQIFRDGSVVSAQSAVLFRGSEFVTLSDYFQRVSLVGDIEYAK